MKNSLGGIPDRFGHVCRTSAFSVRRSAFGVLFFLMAAAAAQAANVLTFQRSTPYTYVSTTGRVSAANFSIECWMRQTTAFDSENQIYCQDNGGTIGNGVGRIFFSTKSAKPFIQVSSSTLTGNTNLTLNTWYHFAITRDANGNAKMYIDGTLVGSAILSKDLPAGTSGNVLVSIGLLDRVKAGFRGDLADLRLWNTARSQAEIQGNRNRRLDGTESGLAHYWPLDEGIGAAANDRAGNADGTISGATWSANPELPIVTSGDAAWASATGGDWSTPSNWLNATPAQGPDITAYFTNDPPAAITVDNGLTGLQLGNLTVNGNGHTFTGNALALTNSFTPSFVVTTNGLHTFALPLQVSPFGLVVSAASGAAFTFSQPIAGPGGFTANPATSGGGTVTLSAASTYAGPTTLGCGTLRIPTLADGGNPSPCGASPSDRTNLLLGPGTLHVTGAASTDRGLTLQAGSGRAVTLRADADLTFGGPVHAASGALIKAGAGTVSLTHPGVNTLAVYEGNSDLLQNAGADGDSPTTGFAGLTVNQGKLVLGVPGQTNVCNQRVSLGAYTTTAAGQETAGELELNGGVFLCNTTFSIGRANGTETTAPGGANARLTLNGGEMAVNLLALGYVGGAGAGFNARPSVDINGGTLSVAAYANIGESTGSVATVTVSGGTLRVTGTDGNSLRIGGPQTVGGVGILTLSGDGLVDAANDVSLANSGSSYGTLNLDGGTLIARNIVKGSGLSGVLNFNGGTFKPRASGHTLSGLTSAYVRSGGARIDTSLASYALAQSLLHDASLDPAADGGLTKLGANTLTLASYESTFTGPTLVADGALKVAGALPPDNDVSIGAAGELFVGGSATQTVAAASLTLADGATLGFAFTASGASNDRLTVAAPVALGNARIALYLADTTLPFTRNGTYPLLSYPGADPATSGLTCANPVYGKSYAFSASGGSLTVTITSDAAASSVWNLDGDGAWALGANWTLPQPGTAGSAARFDSAISGPVTVATAGETAGALYFNSPNTYTLGGTGLTLDSGAVPSTLTVEHGAHTLAAPLTLAGDAALNLSPATLLTLGPVSGSASLAAQGDGTLALTEAPAVDALALNGPEVVFSNSMTLSPPVALQRNATLRTGTGTAVAFGNTLSGTANLTKAGSGTLTLSAANTYTGVTRLDGGTLSVPALANGGQPSPIGASAVNAANLLIGPATFRYTGPSNAVTRGFTLQAGSGRAAVVRVEADGDLALGGWVNATSGGFVKTGPGTLRYTGNANNVLHKDNVGSDAQLNVGANGDGPTQGFFGCSIANGKLVLGAPFQTNTVSSRLVVGINTTTAAGAETAGELEIVNGVLNMNSQVLAVGRNNGTTTTAPGGLASRLTVSGGVITNANYISLGYQIMGLSGYNARPVMQMSGGHVHVNNFYISESSGASATVNLSGGRVTVNTLARFALASGASAMFNLSGDALFQTAANVDVALPYGGASASATLRLNGGTLSTRNILRQGNAGTGILFFNGGTLKPLTSGQTLQNMTAAYVSTNGAAVDTSLASYTVAQNLLADPALGTAADGGLVKLGTNTLSLTGAGNTFNGPVDVRAGLLRARLGATNDLAVATNSVFDALGDRATVADLRGYGLLTNGVIAVTGTLDAGTNNAPAGARMTVQNLSLVGGSTFSCDWATNSVGQVTNDFVTVTGTLAAEGPGFVDFNRTEANPLPMPFTAVIMSYDAFSGTFAGWKAVNTGLPSGSNVALVVTASNGLVTIEVRYGGSLLMLK